MKKKMLRTIVSYVSSFPASQVFYFVISRSATFSLTNLAVIVGFEDLRPSNSHGFQSRLFLIKLPMRRSGDEKLCLKYLKYLQNHMPSNIGQKEIGIRFSKIETCGGSNVMNSSECSK